jgi:DNA-binding beta-propeller fold protein YncE
LTWSRRRRIVFVDAEEVPMAMTILSTDTDDGTVSVVQAARAQDYKCVGSIQVGNAPRGSVKFTKSGRGFVSNCGGDTISEIDVEKHLEVRRISVGPAPRGIGIIPDDRLALVSISGADEIAVVDLTTNKKVEAIAVGRDPRHMAVSGDGKHAWVAIWGDHEVAKLDISALHAGRRGGGSVVATVSVGEGAHPYSVALNERRREVYVANTQAPYMSVIDMKTNREEARIELPSKGGRAVAVRPDGELAYISVEDISRVVAVDLEHREAIDEIPVGPGPRGIALHNSTIIASAFARTTAMTVEKFSFGANTLTVVELDEGGRRLAEPAPYAEVAVGAGPCSVAIYEPSPKR